MGLIIEIIGLESSGKTTLAIHTVANAQKLGLNCCYLDMEQAFDPAYATNLGVDLNKLVFSQPSSGEQCLDTASAFN
jgi:recombination protein RecA